MEHRIRGLTLQQPWAHVVASGTKRIENRSWPPPREMMGEWLAIHAGRTIDPAAAEFLRARGVEPSPDAAYGCVIALARIVDVITASDDPWFFGPYGWVLDPVLPIKPIPCRGALRLWKLPSHVVATLNASIEASR